MSKYKKVVIMKKKLYVILILSIILVIILFLSFNGTKEYSKDIEGVLIFSKTSKLYKYEECKDFYLLNYDDNHQRLKDVEKKCINRVVFKTFKNKKEIEEELNEKYETQLCNNEKRFYDSKNNFTIINYSIEKENKLSKFLNIDYINGKINIDDCNMVFSDIEYGYDYSYKSHSNKFLDYQYYDKDGKIYKVYSDCVDCLTIKNGTGTNMTFRSMLNYEYIDMNIFLNYLEQETETGKTSKEEYINGTLYKNDIFNLFKCKNKTIIISDKLNFSKELCEV